MFYIALIFTVIVCIGYCLLCKYDLNKNYDYIDISYKVLEKYIFVPRKIARPHYDREVKVRFNPGSIIEYDNVHTGFIRIIQYIGIYREDDQNYFSKSYSKYSYEIYEPEEIYTGITPAIEELYIGVLNITLNNINNGSNVTNEEVNYISEFIRNSKKKLKSGEEERLEEVIDALIGCLPGSKYIKLFKVLSKQIYTRK